MTQTLALAATLDAIALVEKAYQDLIRSGEQAVVRRVLVSVRARLERDARACLTGGA